MNPRLYSALFFPVVGLLAGCAHSPSGVELQTALSASAGMWCPKPERAVCSEMSEEPGEFVCSWHERKTGEVHEAVIAQDAGQWVRVDGGKSCGSGG